MNRIVKPTDFDYNTNKQLIEELIKEYPFLKVDICGRTVLGRGIFSLSLGSMHNSVIYAGGFSGSDSVSPLLLYMFIEDLCRCIKTKCSLCSVNMARALSQLGVTVIPCVNPDGREISIYGADSAKTLRKFLMQTGEKNFALWQGNAKGVDIRKNFSYDFEKNKQKEAEKDILDSEKSGLCGEYPESESETKALTRLCRVRPFRQCMAVTSGGESLCRVKGDEELAEVDIMSKIIAQGCFYPIADEKDGNVCGFPCWFASEFSRPAFELKAGKNGNTYSDAAEIYEQVKEAFTVFSLM